MTLREQIAYVRGLIEGSDMTGNEVPARTVWEKMLEIFETVADQMEEVELHQEEVEEYVEAIDADLGDLEDEMFGGTYAVDDGDVDVGTNFVEMECPNCGLAVYFEESFLFDDEDEVACPDCGAIVYVSGTTERLHDGVHDDAVNGGHEQSAAVEPPEAVGMGDFEAGSDAGFGVSRPEPDAPEGNERGFADEDEDGPTDDLPRG